MEGELNLIRGHGDASKATPKPVSPKSFQMLVPQLCNCFTFETTCVLPYIFVQGARIGMWHWQEWKVYSTRLGVCASARDLESLI